MIYSLLLAKGGLFDPIAKPLAAVLAFFYDLVPNYGIAIVLLTIAMMIVLTPLTIKQTRSMLVMQKLQPEMKKLQEQHKNDRQALNEAVMALYKEHNASPLGGCLPMLLPFPLFIGLLRVLEGLSHIDGTTHQAIPKYLSANTKMYQDIVKAHGQLDAFGMNLAKSARNAGGGFAHSLPYFVLLLLMVGTQFYQQYQLTSRNPAAKSQPGQAAMMKFIPLFFGLISLQFPAGVVLYWTVSNLIRVGQQWALYRYDPKVKALVVQDIKEIEAKTREIDAKEKSSGRSRFRDLLGNASEAAADRRNLRGGKNGAKPTGDASGNKSGTPARGSRSQPGKATGGPTPVAKAPRPGTTPPKGVATPKGGTPPKPGAPKGTSQKAVAPRPGGAKPGAARPGAPKQGAPKAAGSQSGPAGSQSGPAGSQSGSPGTAAQKAVPPKAPAESKAAASQSGSPGTAAQKAVPPKAPAESKAAVSQSGSPTAAALPAPASKPPASDSGPGGTNGSAKPPVVTTAGNGAVSGTDVDKAAGNGGPAEAADIGADAPIKGRTGGGSARNVGGRHRRKGR